MSQLQKAMVAAFNLPEGSVMCGPSPMQGYLAIHIPMTAEVLRTLADAMDEVWIAEAAAKAKEAKP